MPENTQSANYSKSIGDKSQTFGRRPYNNSTTSQGNRGRSNFTRPGGSAPRAGFKRPGQGGPSRGGKPFVRRKLTKDELQKQKEKKLRLERLEKTYVRLHEAFPNAFDRANVKPLKRDIHKEIFEYFNSENEPTESPVKKSALRSFLTQYIRSDIYHRAVIKYGKRFNLDGSEDLPFTEEEIQYHRDNMSKKPKPTPRRPASGRTVIRGSGTRTGFGSRTSQRPAFGQREGYATKAGVRNNIGFRTPRPASSFVRTPTATQAEFKPGDQVLCGGNRTGVVKEVIGSSVKVILDTNGYTILLKQDSVKHVK